ncbi:MAG: hypothetical protein QOK60_06640 [Nitrososphaeraceae archaeon]|nr:hypothetical protein [Nitrososphaeraceae archaeon]
MPQITLNVQKLVDDDLKASGIMDFKLEDLMKRIQAGEWEFDYNTTSQANIT